LINIFFFKYFNLKTAEHQWYEFGNGLPVGTANGNMGKYCGSGLKRILWKCTT